MIFLYEWVLHKEPKTFTHLNITKPQLPILIFTKREWLHSTIHVI